MDRQTTLDPKPDRMTPIYWVRFALALQIAVAIWFLRVLYQSGLGSYDVPGVAPTATSELANKPLVNSFLLDLWPLIATAGYSMASIGHEWPSHDNYQPLLVIKLPIMAI